MSLCNIPLLTSFIERLHGFASNFVWVFLGWTPTKFVNIGCYLYFSWNNGIILCNFWPITKNSYSSRPLTRNHS